MVPVDMNIAGLDEAEWDRPPDFAGFPTVRQLPFYLCRDSSVPRKLPIGVPIRNHLEAYPDGEWVPRDDCADIGQQIGVNEFPAFVSLAVAERHRAEKNGSQESAARAPSGLHGVTYHRANRTATKRAVARPMLHKSACVVHLSSQCWQD